MEAFARAVIGAWMFREIVLQIASSDAPVDATHRSSGAEAWPTLSSRSPDRDDPDDAGLEAVVDVELRVAKEDAVDGPSVRRRVGDAGLGDAFEHAERRLELVEQLVRRGADLA